jgi:hypothetical protein
MQKSAYYISSLTTTCGAARRLLLACRHVKTVIRFVKKMINK